MEQSYRQETRRLEDQASQMRAMGNKVNAMMESCHELQLLLAGLHNPDTMNHMWETEAELKQSGAQVNAVLGTILVKIECTQEEMQSDPDISTASEDLTPDGNGQQLENRMNE